jgi:TonB family protein
MCKTISIVLYFTFNIFCTISIYSQNGIIKSFYPNGSLKSEISYVNDVYDGYAYFFFLNGNLKSERNFSRGILNGFVREFYENGLMKEEYFMRNGIIDGNFRKYHTNGALAQLIVFENGVQIENKHFEFDSLYFASTEDYKIGNRQQELMSNKKQDLICDVEICPVPVGGMQAIQDNLIYPEHALLYGLEGTVLLIANINEYGEVLNTEVIKELGLGCDEAAQEAVKRTKFIPGQNNNRAVFSRVTIEVEFKIFNNSSVESKNVNNKNDLSKSKNFNDIENKSALKSITIECDIEECPFPIGGMKTIIGNLIIPSIAKRLKLKGAIIIEALIDNYGIAQNTVTKKGIGYGCDDAVESAIMRTKFKPGRKGGSEISSIITIHFPFSYE